MTLCTADQKTRLRSLRSEQVDLLAAEANHARLSQFYQKVVDNINKQLIQQTDAYALMADLFEDCPESQLQDNFSLFKQIQTQVRLEENQLHYCTKVVRTCLGKLTITHDLQFRGALQRFLAKIMPLTHVTGVNLLGKFNDTNPTSVETFAEIRQTPTGKKSAEKIVVS